MSTQKPSVQWKISCRLIANPGEIIRKWRGRWPKFQDYLPAVGAPELRKPEKSPQTIAAWSFCLVCSLKASLRLRPTKKPRTNVQGFVLSGWQDNLFFNKRRVHNTFTENQFDVSPNDSPNFIKQRAIILFVRLCVIKIWFSLNKLFNQLLFHIPTSFFSGCQITRFRS